MTRDFAISTLTACAGAENSKFHKYLIEAVTRGGDVGTFAQRASTIGFLRKSIICKGRRAAWADINEMNEKYHRNFHFGPQITDCLALRLHLNFRSDSKQYLS